MREGWEVCGGGGELLYDSKKLCAPPLLSRQRTREYPTPHSAAIGIANEKARQRHGLSADTIDQCRLLLCDRKGNRVVLRFVGHGIGICEGHSLFTPSLIHTTVGVIAPVHAAKYLQELVHDAKNGGEKALKKAVEHRLDRLRQRNSTGLFKWVDGTSDHGYFIAIMRGTAVHLVKRFGSEIFIDR